jgi:hypothetical protein
VRTGLCGSNPGFRASVHLPGAPARSTMTKRGRVCTRPPGQRRSALRTQ